MAMEHRNPRDLTDEYAAEPLVIRPDPAVKVEKGPALPDLEVRTQSQLRLADLVDEESMESFPASDPPSHTRSHS